MRTSPVGASTPEAAGESRTAGDAHVALRDELVGLICETLRREPVDPATVTDATPCVGGPLLLDSLDVLELVVAIDRVYGVSLRDGEVGRTVLRDMGTLTRFVAEHRASASEAARGAA